jgi:AsmA protein
MDLSGLKEADADLSLTAGKVSFAGMALGQSTLSVRLRDGVLSADLPSVALYGGQGSAKLVLDAKGATPSLNTTLSFNAIAVEPFLRDTSAFDRLSGTGAMTLSLTSRGASERAMMESLNGTGSLKLVNGAIHGVNLNTMMRDVSNLFTKGQLSQGIYTGAAIGPSQRTEFSEFGGTFTIQNGLLANNDLLLVNPELRVSGSGTTSIVSRTVDYRLVSRFMESVEGEDGALQVSAAVPVHVRGTWESLKFQPDAKALVGGALKGVTEALGAGEDPLKGALKGLFGRPGATPKEESAQPSDGAQGSSGGEGTWAPNATKVDEGGGESAPAEDGATAEEKAPTPEEQIRNIFQGILKEE